MIASIVQYTGRMLGKGGGDGADSPKTDAGVKPEDRHVYGDRPLLETEFVVFDTELTGLKARKDSIVSLGAVRMRGERILLGESFYRLVEPRTAMTARSVVIHEITPSETAGSPAIDALLPEFLDFCDDAVVVGHVVSIDLQFLNRELKQLYGRPLKNSAADTFKLYQWIREREEDGCAYHCGQPESVDLFTLAKKYQIPVQHAHNALGDAFITAQLFQRLLHELPRWGLTTLADLLRVGRP